MHSMRKLGGRIATLAAFIFLITTISVRLRADTGTCGGAMLTLPFTDVAASNIFFCSIAEAFFLSLTSGTTPTTYSPSSAVTREQMAAFITRTHDSALKRGSTRAALNQWAMIKPVPDSATTTVGISPQLPQSDGADVWVPNFSSGTVSRVRASDGRLLETWTGATNANMVVVDRGRIFVSGQTSPGKVYRIDPRQAAGAVSVVSSSLDDHIGGIASDGTFLWVTSDFGQSVTRLDPDTGTSTVFTSGFSSPFDALFDGSNIWVVDPGSSQLKKLNPNGTVAQSVSVGANSLSAIFDGTNIWVANASDNSITVVRAAGGTVLATLTGNGLMFPRDIAFDGQRILVTNQEGDSVSLWKASDLTPIGTITTGMGTAPTGVCSDGINFWITINGKLARF